MIQPMPARGNVNFTTVLETGNNPAIRMTPSGYMQMRWYQHRTHGGSFITSLKKRLPSVARLAINHAVKIVPQAVHDEQSFLFMHKQ